MYDNETTHRFYKVQSMAMTQEFLKISVDRQWEKVSLCSSNQSS